MNMNLHIGVKKMYKEKNIRAQGKTIYAKMITKNTYYGQIVKIHAHKISHRQLSP